jgi:hypothetical protein
VICSGILWTATVNIIVQLIEEGDDATSISYLLLLCAGWIIIGLSWIAITIKMKSAFPDLVFSPKPERIEDMLQFQLSHEPNVEFAMKLTSINLQRYQDSLVDRQNSHKE